MTKTVATTDPQQKTPQIIQDLNLMTGEIQRALPKHITADRIARLVLTEIRKNPRLAESTRESFFGALMTASALGLEPGVNGEAWLVPYKRKNRRTGEEWIECQFIAGYQGIAKLFWQHPLAARLSAEYVCENDEFDYDKGLVQRLHHTPATGNRGAITHYYAVVGLTNGAVQFDVFTPDEIKQLRGKEGADVPDPQHWMERKTALKQVLKLMPKNVEVGYVMRADEQTGSLAVAKAVATKTALPELPPPDVNVETGEVDQGEPPWVNPMEQEAQGNA